MYPLSRTLHSPADDPAAVRRMPHGVISMCDGQAESVKLTRLPKTATLAEIYTLGKWTHGRRPGDRLWLYYNRAPGFPQYLALAYVVSTKQATYRSLLRAMATLDLIAEIKESDAILCQLSNSRISSRLMTRFGYEAHLPGSRCRHFIKRFYGNYRGSLARIGATEQVAQATAPEHGRPAKLADN